VLIILLGGDLVAEGQAPVAKSRNILGTNNFILVTDAVKPCVSREKPEKKGLVKL
jgi:hypothetical protein